MAQGRFREDFTIASEDLQLDPSSVGYNGNTLKHACEAVERDLIQRILDKTGGNITRAASELGGSSSDLT